MNSSFSQGTCESYDPISGNLSVLIDLGVFAPPAFSSSGILQCVADNRVFRATGDLHIDIDYCFENITLLLDEGVSIFYDDGGTDPFALIIGSLTFDNCNLVGCEKMWGGIVVTGGFKDLTIKNSLIQDATKGISTSIAEGDLFQGKLFLSNTRFLNNYYGIFFQNRKLKFLEFVGNTFSANSLKAPSFGARGYAGIYSENLSIDLIGENNEFSSLDYGVVINNGNLNINGSSFENLNDEDFQNGIRANNGKIQVRQCGFNDCYVGVLAEECNGININSNKGFRNCYRGISITNSSMININEHKIYPFINCQTGILIEDSGVIQSIGNNGFNDCLFAIRLKRTTGKIPIVDNSVSNSKIGIYSKSSGRLDINGNTISAIQYGIFSIDDSNVEIKDNPLIEVTGKPNEEKMV